MALSGLDIFKKLPKTNCGECKFPTCLAFAMQLAAGKAELASCPYVSDEVKEELAEAAAPPIRTVEVGVGDRSLTVGGETVLFRHEKTFVNPTGIGVLVTDTMSEDEVSQKVKQANELMFPRVGIELRPDLVCVSSDTGDAQKFEDLVKKVVSESEVGLVLMAKSVDALKAGLAAAKEKKPLLYAATKDNYEELSRLSKEYDCPLAVYGKGLDELSAVAEKLVEAGHKNLVLDPGSRTLQPALADQTFIRRAALKGSYRPFGFPTIAFASEMADDPMKEAISAAALIAKYAGIVILSDLDPARLLPLLVLRLNIFTDPQRPMTMDEGIYEINGPDKDSPVLVTTNFALTYFIVSGEIEASKKPTWLLIKDTDGLSTLTAWSAGKFSGDLIAPFVKKCGIEDKIGHRKIVIPGYVAQIKGEVEEELAGWQVEVGPREASDIPVYLQRYSTS